MKVKFPHAVFLLFSNDSERFSHRVQGKKKNPTQENSSKVFQCSVSTNSLLPIPLKLSIRELHRKEHFLGYSANKCYVTRESKTLCKTSM